MIEVTEHAYKRARKRLGLNKSATRNLASKAFVGGIRCSSNSALWDDYMEWKSKTSPAVEVVLYGDVIFTFDGIKLLTVYTNKRKKRS